MNLTQKEQANLMILHHLIDITGLAPSIESGRAFGFYSNDAGFAQFLYDETLQLENQQAKAWLEECCQKVLP